MACVNLHMAWQGNSMGMAWAWHAMCESVFCVCQEFMVWQLVLSAPEALYITVYK